MDRHATTFPAEGGAVDGGHAAGERIYGERQRGKATVEEMGPRTLYPREYLSQVARPSTRDPTFSGTLTLKGRTRYGTSTSPTSRWPRDSCTVRPSSTFIPERSSAGASQQSGGAVLRRCVGGGRKGTRQAQSEFPPRDTIHLPQMDKDCGGQGDKGLNGWQGKGDRQ